MNYIKLNVIIEIPKNSKVKYEIMNNKLFVDRILYGSNVYPQNYGFIENTIDYDGDALDCLVISDQAFLPTSSVPVRVIGAMEMIDGGEEDTKLIAVIDVDPRYDSIKNISDVNKNVLEEIRDFFKNYKNLQKKEVIVKKFRDVAYANEVLKETKDLYKKYKDLSKEDFIEKNKIINPEKYK